MPDKENASRLPYLALHKKKGDTFQFVQEILPKILRNQKQPIPLLLQSADTPRNRVNQRLHYCPATRREHGTISPEIHQRNTRFSKVPNMILMYDYEFNMQKPINMSMPIPRIAGNCYFNTLYAVAYRPEFCISKH